MTQLQIHEKKAMNLPPGPVLGMVLRHPAMKMSLQRRMRLREGRHTMTQLQIYEGVIR